jgi:hypothetical protein
MYSQLDGETALIPASIKAMDGNFSLKWVDDSHNASDAHTFPTDYVIPVEDVDHFKDDVRLKPGVSQNRQ